MTFIYVFCFTNISHPPFAIFHVLLLFYIYIFIFTIHLISLPRFPLLFNFYYLFHQYLKIFISSLNFHHYVPFSHSFYSFPVSISLTPRFAFISITSFQVIGLLPHSVRLPFPSPIHIWNKLLLLTISLNLLPPFISAHHHISLPLFYFEPLSSTYFSHSSSVFLRFCGLFLSPIS